MDRVTPPDNLFEATKKMLDELIALRDGQDVTDEMKKRLETVGTQVAGVVSGHLNELRLAQVHIKKKREVVFGKRGDVAIDYREDYGKAIQSKSCFAVDAAAVDKHIRTAAVQLSGMKSKKETPTPTDRRAIDICIHNPQNDWPGQASPTLLDVVTQVHKCLLGDNKKKAGYSKWNELEAAPSVPGTSSGGKGFHSRPTKAGDIDLVVKVRWSQPKSINVDGGQQNLVEIVTRTVPAGDTCKLQRTTCILLRMSKESKREVPTTVVEFPPSAIIGNLSGGCGSAVRPKKAKKRTTTPYTRDPSDPQPESQYPKIVNLIHSPGSSDPASTHPPTNPTSSIGGSFSLPQVGPWNPAYSAPNYGGASPWNPGYPPGGSGVPNLWSSGYALPPFVRRGAPSSQTHAPHQGPGFGAAPSPSTPQFMRPTSLPPGAVLLGPPKPDRT